MIYNKTVKVSGFFDDITPYRLAKHLDISPSYMYRVKTEKYAISEEQYKRFLEAKIKILDSSKSK